MRSARVIAYTLFTVVLATILGLTWPDLVARVAYAVDTGQAAAAREKLKSAQDLSTAFQYVADTLRPSVVNVRTERRVEMSSRGSSEDEMLRRFFGDGFNFGPRFRGGDDDAPADVMRGQGTGVIVRENGYIVTNKHVVWDADEVTVTLSDGRYFDAETVGFDPESDLAVLKINASDLLPAEFGDSEEIKVGEWVLAMGDPFGLSQTVTAGIVSALGRSIQGRPIGGQPATFQDMIQTDAAINPGNSGGPLVDLNGHVIGINTAIYSRSGGFQGIGFAIPARIVSKVVRDLITEGEVIRGYLGVNIQDLTPDLAASFGLDSARGVLVTNVQAGTPAEEAGLQVEDIITHFDGEPMGDADELMNEVASTDPGTPVELRIFRDGERQTVSVTVGERDAEMIARAMRDGMQGESRRTQGLDRFGLSLRAVTPEEAAMLNLPSDDLVVIDEVEPGSPADDRGLRRGDVVMRIGSQDIASLSDVRAALRDQDLEDGVRVKIMRGGAARYYFLRP
jgi:serine protease Do